MIHIPAIIVGALVWYYDPELRKLCTKHVKPHVDKAESEVKKIYQKARRRMVNTETDDSQE